MAIRVELKSPYGRLNPGGLGKVIKNGRRGWTTRQYEGRKPMVRFDGRKIAIAVPEHWIAYAGPKSLTLG